jgi:hypothetical protein
MKTIQELTPIAVALITAIFGPVAVTWVKLKFSNIKKTTPVAEAININSLVDTQLEKILDELECDRIWLAQFHNGGNFYPTGKSIQKFSVFYEKLSPNTPPIQGILQNIPSSLFPKALAKIHKDGEIAIPSTKNATEFYGLENLSSQFKTRSLYMVGLYSIDNHLIGVMGLAFEDKEKELQLEEWILLRQKVGVIGTLLTEYLYANPKKKK